MKVLKPKNEKIRKRDIAAFDIETYSDKNLFLMGSVAYKRPNDKEPIIKVFWNKYEMRKFLLSRRLENNLIFAHNLGFDFFALYEDIEIYRHFDLVMRNDRFICIKPKKELPYRNTYLDTFNFMPSSLEKIGEILKIPKSEKPKFLGKKPKTNYDRFILEQYNKQDTLITYKFAEFLQDSFNEMGTNIKYTLPSTAMSLFKNRYLKYWIEQPEKDILIDLFKAYYGGRNESFYRGHVKNVNYYDINSLYPYVMKKYKYPNTNTMQKIDTPDLSVLKYEGVAYCDIIAPYMFYPVLPFRHENKLCFPIGEFSGHYTFCELRKAQEKGYTIKINYAYVCTESYDLFSDFVTDMYNKRMEYKKIGSPLETIYKLCGNGLYGKFGQKLETSEILFLNSEEDFNKFNRYCNINADRQEQKQPLRYKITTPHEKFKKTSDKKVLLDETEMYYIIDTDVTDYASFVNPMIAAYVTSYARLELYNLLENNDVYYCDTDSIMTPNELKTSSDLGDIKLEIKADEGIIVKPKFYYLHSAEKEFIKSKGLSNLKTFLDFKNILITKHYKYSKIAKFKESLRRGLSFNEIIEIEKILDLEDNKRQWKNEFNPQEFEKSEPIKI